MAINYDGKGVMTMRKLLTMAAVLVVVGCSGLNHAMERLSSGKQANSISINGQIQGACTTEFEEAIVTDEEGKLLQVPNMTKPVLVCGFRAEDGTPFEVQCPNDRIDFCRLLIGGEWVKVGGFKNRPVGAERILATYIKTK